MWDYLGLLTVLTSYLLSFWLFKALCAVGYQLERSEGVLSGHRP